MSKAFGGRAAVTGLTLDVPAGSVFGLIGPNGSGKTTLLRMALDLIRPDQGSIELLGKPGAVAGRDRVSYLPEERGLYRKMPLSEMLHYFGALKGVSSRRLQVAVPRWLERLGLSAWAQKDLDALSKGMAQKVQFIAALLSEPDLLVLDEPFSGLDPAAVHEMKTVIQGLKAQGRTVILATHLMPSAEELCDRVGMLHQGRLLLNGRLESIKKAHGGARIRIRSDRSLAQLRRMMGVDTAQAEGRFQTLTLTVDPQRFLSRLLKRAKVRHFEADGASLNDVFLGALHKAGAIHAAV